MANIFVKKDGTGNSASIQGAIPLASNGDIIHVEAGTFEENIDLYKDGITIIGAGKDQTIIMGQQQSAVTKAGCTWALGSTTISVPAGTSGLKAGHVVAASGIPVNSRIVTVGATSFTISAATTAARTNVSVTMAAIDSAVRWRGIGNTLKQVKVKGVQALATRAAADTGAIYFRPAGLGASGAANYLVEDCEIEAMGDSAIMCDNTGVGGGIVRNCVFSGKTFVGENPAQVHAFSSLPLSCNILTSTTIELPSAEYLVDVKVGSPILAVTDFVQASTTVSAINGNVLTLNKALLSGVGTTQTITFTNIQFNIPNVARQLAVFQPNNTAPVTFTNNIVNGVTGGGISFNSAVTCDVPSSTVTGNKFYGTYGQMGYALRVRGINSVVNDNFNLSESANLGFYIVPNWSASAVVSVGTICVSSSKYWQCIQAHTTSAANSPTSVDAALYWSEITLEQVNASGVYGIAQVVGTNSNVLAVLIQTSQTESNQPISVSLNKGILKAVSKVSSDATFSSDANWRMVAKIYKHESSNKRMFVGLKSFDSAKPMKLRNGNPGEKFQLIKIIISDQSRNLLVLKRNEIPNAASFDITLK